MLLSVFFFANCPSSQLISHLPCLAFDHHLMNSKGFSQLEQSVNLILALNDIKITFHFLPPFSHIPKPMQTNMNDTGKRIRKRQTNAPSAADSTWQSFRSVQATTTGLAECFHKTT